LPEILQNLLEISDLTIEYRLGQLSIKALDSINLILPSKSYTLGVVGESGSGKTTLGMSILNAIETPGIVTNGKIEWEGRNVLGMNEQELRRYRWQEVSMVYQSAMNSLNPVKNVLSHIVEVIRQHEPVGKSEATQRAKELLSDVGIGPDRIKSFPHEFSGGMRQRVAIAMALALNPKLVIADEPTSALDVVIQRQIIDLLNNKVKERGLSLIFITHEISLLRGLVQNIVVMYSGQIAEFGPTGKILSAPLHPYTEMLVESLEYGKEDLLRHKRRSLENVKPVSSTKDSCIYVGRCKYAFERCSHERPVLTQVQEGRWVACHKYQN
jgi:oligopeptide/dipeptide ABC transporter ATP-binding protein